MDSSPPIRLLVSDPSALVLLGLEALLGHFDDIVVETTTDPYPTERSDLLLVGDAFSHDELRTRVARGISSGRHRSVAAFAWHVSHSDRALLLADGCAGVISKDRGGPQLRQAVCQLAAGEHVVDAFSNGTTAHRVVAEQNLLTDQESELLALIASGLSNRQVAEVMFIAENTVKTYLKRIYKKIGARNRAAATMRALELGILRDHRPPGLGDRSDSGSSNF